MDKNSFFRDATLAICSNLDSEVALFRCYKFLSQHIPLDAIYMNAIDHQLGRINYHAKADNTGGKRLEWSIALQEETFRLNNIEKGQVFISNNSPGITIEEQKREACGHKNSSLATLLLKSGEHNLGAIDLFAKGWNRYTPEHAELLLLLNEPFSIAMSNTLRYWELEKLKENLNDDNKYLTQTLIKNSGSEVVGANKGLKHVMEMVSQVASLNSTVLLHGETGTGKEVIANAIHKLSNRRDEPMIKVNCGAIPDQLIDSELFGHEKGSFTGATTQRRGRFERAHKGTIFLDEIGELPLSAQVRLLRVIQNREIERIGGYMSTPVDIRIICATHQNLEELIKQGKFREDLWFRVNTFPIHIPPLRHRKEDILDLTHFFIEKKSMEMNSHTPHQLAPGTIDRLMSYEWPGNVRELENAVERELIQNKTGTLFFNMASPSFEKPQPGDHQRSFVPNSTLDRVFQEYITEVLQFTNGKVHGPKGAAKILDINPHTLSDRMKKLGIPFGRKYKKKGTG